MMMKEKAINIKLSYLYRDGHNYKNFGSVIFSNPQKKSIEEIQALIKENLIEDQWFNCKDWNIPDLHFKEFDYNTNCDHDWHEFENIEETTDEPTEQVCLESFLLLIKQTQQ